VHQDSYELSQSVLMNIKARSNAQIPVGFLVLDRSPSDSSSVFASFPEHPGLVGTLHTAKKLVGLQGQHSYTEFVRL